MVDEEEFKLALFRYDSNGSPELVALRKGEARWFCCNCGTIRTNRIDMRDHLKEYLSSNSLGN